MVPTSGENPGSRICALVRAFFGQKTFFFVYDNRWIEIIWEKKSGKTRKWSQNLFNRYQMKQIIAWEVEYSNNNDKQLLKY